MTSSHGEANEDCRLTEKDNGFGRRSFSSRKGKVMISKCSSIWRISNCLTLLHGKHQSEKSRTSIQVVWAFMATRRVDRSSCGRQRQLEPRTCRQISRPRMVTLMIRRTIPSFRMFTRTIRNSQIAKRSSHNSKIHTQTGGTKWRSRVPMMIGSRRRAWSGTAWTSATTANLAA